MVNATFLNQTTSAASSALPPISLTDPAGFFTLIIGVALVVIAIYIVFKVVKNLIANAVIGGVGLIILHFVGPVIGLNVEISLLNIVVSLVAGLPGLVIVLVLTILGM